MLCKQLKKNNENKQTQIKLSYVKHMSNDQHMFKNIW